VRAVRAEFADRCRVEHYAPCDHETESRTYSRFGGNLGFGLGNAKNSPNGKLGSQQLVRGRLGMPLIGATGRDSSIGFICGPAIFD
jgi:hypothetical protein